MLILEDCIAFLASRASKEMADIHEKLLASTGITRVQWMALYYINGNNSITQKELASLLGSKEPTIVRLLDRMEKDGLVVRVRKDRRTNLVELTDKGNELFLAGLDITERYKDQALKGISEEQMESFKTILDKMLDNARQKGGK